MVLCGIDAYENNGARTRFCNTHLMDIDFLTQEIDSTNVFSDMGPDFSWLVSRKSVCEGFGETGQILPQLIQFVSYVATMYL